MSSPPIIFVDDYDFNITNDNNDTIDSTNSLLPSTFNSNNSNVRLSSSYRWMILLGFSLLTFSSACLWITFAPCLYIFMSYFSQSPSSINSLSSVYMIMYPILLIPSINFFNTYGVKCSVIFGAFLNSLGAFFRFLGSLNRSYIGFWVLFFGQAIASIAQLFILS
ncbi:3753_t:CDS:1, partial [Dentiscutata erythropus]